MFYRIVSVIYVLFVDENTRKYFFKLLYKTSKSKNAKFKAFVSEFAWVAVVSWCINFALLKFKRPGSRFARIQNFKKVVRSHEVDLKDDKNTVEHSIGNTFLVYFDNYIIVKVFKIGDNRLAVYIFMAAGILRLIACHSENFIRYYSQSNMYTNELRFKS